MSVKRQFLFWTMGFGVMTILSHWALGFSYWTWLYAVIYVCVLIAEWISYARRGYTISTAYQKKLKEASGVKKWVLLVPWAMVFLKNVNELT